MKYQHFIKAIVYITFLFWTILLYVNHEAIHPSFFRPVSMVTTGVVSIAIAFDLWLWKFRIFRGWLVKRPLIGGTWKVEMISDWVSDEDDERKTHITGYMVVNQTLSTLTMRQLTTESTSSLIGTELICSPEKIYCVSGVYLNIPRLAVRGRSAIHYGALWLEVSEDTPPSLTGHYWTDRKTAGSITLTNRNTRKFQSFATADTAFEDGD
jgi:hypothetical protein